MIPAQTSGGFSYRFGMDSSIGAGGNSAFNMYNASAYRFRGSAGNGDAVIDTYNLPGGASGSLVTNTFSLKGYSALDKPTFYFNYLLDTEGAAGTADNSAMRDSFRVFVSDDGINWHQLATNNSTRSLFFGSAGAESELSPTYRYSGGDYLNDLSSNARESQSRVQEAFDTNNWRQARVDLGDFAGRENLRLRFDFSTAGDMNEHGKLKLDVPAGGFAALEGRTIGLSVPGFSQANYPTIPFSQSVFTLELDTNGSVAAGNVRVDITGVTTNEGLAQRIADVVNARNIANNTIISARTVSDRARVASVNGIGNDRTTFDGRDTVLFEVPLQGERVIVDPSSGGGGLIVYSASLGPLATSTGWRKSSSCKGTASATLNRSPRARTTASAVSLSTTS